jgi:hypothetical protein
MAYLHSRSGIARSGVTHAAWVPPSHEIRINGTVRTSSVPYGWTIVDRVDGTPSVFTFRLKAAVTPAVGHRVLVKYATPDDYLFVGTLLQIDQTNWMDDGLFEWSCVALGDHWLLDRYDLVLARYQSTGVRSMVVDILSRFTNGGSTPFTAGYIPSSLGNLDMEFTFETVTGALNRIARAVDAYWEVTPFRAINLFQTPNEAALPTVTIANAIRVRYREDLTQVRTRSLFQGQGSTAAAAANVGASTIAVEDTTPFSDSGGTVVSGPQTITYTGRTMASGPGSLTGVSGIVFDIDIGDPVDLLVEIEDSGAQTALATLLGGGLSGQATHRQQDGRISQGEATGRATADVAAFGGALAELDFTTLHRHMKIGRELVVSLSGSTSISGTYRIQQITTEHRVSKRGTLDLWRHVNTSPFTRKLTDILQQLAG